MPMLIGIAGKARSGKDTFADFLFEDHEFTKTAFAGALKVAALHAFGEDDPSVFATQEGKASANDYWQMTRRKMLQDFGECLCEEFGDDFWMKRWFLDYAEFADTDHIVVTDVRKDIEASLIRSLGGVVVHMVREGAGIDGPESQHKTEQGITLHQDDIIVENEGTIDDLREAAKVIVEYCKVVSA